MNGLSKLNTMYIISHHRAQNYFAGIGYLMWCISVLCDLTKIKLKSLFSKEAD